MSGNVEWALAAKKVLMHSNGTVAWLIHNLVYNIGRSAQSFLDVQLLLAWLFWWCICIFNMIAIWRKNILFSVSQPTNTTNSEMFKAVNNIASHWGLDFKFYLGICSNGTTTRTGQHSRVVTQIVVLTLESFIHQESSATKKSEVIKCEQCESPF